MARKHQCHLEKVSLLMKLLKEVDRGLLPNGRHTFRRGLFLCQFCNQEVTRAYYQGLKFRSCGCVRVGPGKLNPNYRHGGSHTKLYVMYRGMMNRCYNAKNQDYSTYGGSGVVVCKAWHEFSKFQEWAIQSGYRHGLLIDRIKHGGNYSPKNCRWLTPKDSCRHRRVVKFTQQIADSVRGLLADGLTQAEIGRRLGVARQHIGGIARGKLWRP